MDQSKLRKPANLNDEIWQQHLDWMNVAGRQVDENFVRHQKRVREDASRNEALADLHQEALQGERRTRSMFCIRD